MAVPQTFGLLAGVPRPLTEEFNEALLSGNRFRVERIVSRGHASPARFWYDQSEHEWVLLVSGAARLRFDGDGADADVELKPGDHLLIPAHRRHRVEWTAPDVDTVWLAIFYKADGAGSNSRR